MIDFGPYALDTPLGRGGMGVVWGGRHRRSGEPVAIKVLTVAGAARPDFVRAFRSEVRAVAGLDHPRVVAVFDHGTVPDEAAATSVGRLVAGSPYLAMARLDGGSLAAWRGSRTWPAVRQILLDLLDALAHAHARGVIHRDLKPANLLLDDHGRIQLTDFGLAHLVRGQALGQGAEALSGGTPASTAPEQFLGAWRELGPWTDLYAVGCLGFRLVCGHGPFRVRGWIDGRRQHTTAPIPRLDPKIAVPDGLEAWLARCLRKAPADRFQRAADAAWALRGLGEADGEARTVDATPAGSTQPMSSDPNRTTLVWMGSGGGGARSEVPRPGDPPPMPPSWRRPRRPRRWLAGVGLGLVGLRAVPVVGREAERDQLWQALRDVHGAGGPGGLVLHGPAGTGKSRLVEWVTRRAHEVGAAQVVQVTHQESEGALDGWGPAIARTLQLDGLAPEALRARLDEVGGPDGRDLAAVLAPVPGQAPSAETRRRTVQAWLSRLAASRPLIVWIDDAQWGLDAIVVAERLLQGQAPILVVLTARDDALATQPENEALLRALPVPWVPIGPLPPLDRQALVRELLGLRGALAAQVEARTEGNPLFAVQLVGDWVQRGLLVPGPDGYALAPGARATVPDDLADVWAARTDRVVAPEDLPAVELAATLGTEVRVDEWAAACAVSGRPVPWAAVDALLEARLVRADPAAQRLSFVHAMVPEALVARATAEGRAAAHHRACAAVLAERGAPLRQGRHLLAAGDDAAALQPLLDGVQQGIGLMDYRLAAGPLEARAAALQRLGIGEDDPRWAEGQRQLARLQRLRGQWGAARDTLAVLVALSDRHGWVRAGIEVRGELGLVLRGLGELDGAREVLERAAEAARREGIGVDRIATRLVMVLQDLGDWERAGALGRETLAQLDADGAVIDAAQLRVAMAVGLSNRRRFDEAEQLLLAAKQAFENTGALSGVANACNNLGEVARYAGRYDDAAGHYRASLDRYERMGSGHAPLPRANLGLVLLELDRPDDALDALEHARSELARQGRRPLVGVLSVGIAVAALALGDGTRAAAELRDATRVLERTGGFDLDASYLAERLARAAEDHGDPALAEEAWRLALVQARRLGQDDRIARATAALGPEAVPATVCGMGGVPDRDTQ